MHKTFSKHTFRILAGQEAFNYNYEAWNYSSTEIPEIQPNLSSSIKDNAENGYAYSKQTFLSFFGIADYNFDDKYLATFSLRTDGNSRFGENSKYATFYSAGFSWNAHNENFLKNVDIINQLKLRASYGISGNDGIGNFTKFGNMGSVEINGGTGYLPNSLSNNSLTWEKVRNINGGVDFALFGRVQGSIDFYQRVTTSMLLERDLSRTTGFSSLDVNMGELVNQGAELSINVNVLKDGPLKLDVRGNFARNVAEITDLGGLEEMNAWGFLRHKKGREVYSYYLPLYAGVNPANGMAMLD
ncbi:MAG: TonB-dependent receptor [Chloroflexia bacterium]|nr:TonB-dependent receptor [Chloroflexia bacterium]